MGRGRNGHTIGAEASAVGVATRSAANAASAAGAADTRAPTDNRNAPAPADNRNAPAPPERQRGLRRHSLMPAPIRRKLPPLYATDGQGLDAEPHLKLFGGSRFSMYVTEWDGGDELFGYIVSNDGPAHDGFGYASFSELESARDFSFGPVAFPAIERDCGWHAESVRDALEADGLPVPDEFVLASRDERRQPAAA